MSTVRNVFAQTPQIPSPENYPLSMWEQQPTWPVCSTRGSCSGKSRTAPIRW